MKARAVSVTLVLGLLLGVLVSPSVSAFNYSWTVLEQDPNTTAVVNAATVVALTDTSYLILVVGGSNGDVQVQKCGNPSPSPYCLIKNVYTASTAAGAGSLVRVSDTQAFGCAAFTNGANQGQVAFLTNNGGNTWTSYELTTVNGGGSCQTYSLSASVQYVAYEISNAQWFVKFTDGTPAAAVQITTASSDVRAFIANDAGTTIRAFVNSAGPTVTYYESTDSGATWAAGVTVTNLAGIELFNDGTVKTGDLSAITCAQEGSNYVFADTSNMGTNWAKSTITAEVADHACIPRLIEDDGSEVGACIPTFGGNIPVRFAHSEDFGGSWTLDTVYDDGAAIASVAGCGFDITPGGVFIVAAHYDPNGAAPPEMVLAQSGNAASSIGAAATSATFTNLGGFSVDKTGTLVLIRTDTGQQVRSLSGSSLVSINNEDTDCDDGEGVMAQNTPSEGAMAFYLRCNAGGGPDKFQIRTAGLGIPDLNGCPDAITECYNLEEEEFEGATDGDQAEFSETDQIPIDMSVRSTSGLNRWQTAWAWTGKDTKAGEAGIAVFTKINQADDDAKLHRIAVHGTSGILTDICTGVDDGQAYFAVVGNDGPSKAYPFSFFNETNLDLELVLRADIDTPAVFSGSANEAAGVACGGGLIIINTYTQVSVWDRAGGASPLWVEDCTCTAHGSAISHVRPDGKQFAGWIDQDGTWTVVHAGNKSEVANGVYSYDAATYQSVVMDMNAQNLFIASDNIVERFPISEATGEISEESGDDEAAVPTGGIFGPGVANLVSTGTFSAFGASLFMGVLMMAGMAVTLGSSPAILTKGQSGFSIVLALIGVILGFLLAWAFGLFSTSVVASVVILALIGIGIRVWISRNSGV